MNDSGLRALELRARETGAVSDVMAYFHAFLRSVDLTPTPSPKEPPAPVPYVDLKEDYGALMPAPSAVIRLRNGWGRLQVSQSGSAFRDVVVEQPPGT